MPERYLNLKDSNRQKLLECTHVGGLTEVLLNAFNNILTVIVKSVCVAYKA